MMRQYHLRLMTVADVDLVLSWRNHPSIRSVMLTQHAITVQEHAEWFNASKANPDKKLLICEDGSGPFGFVQFVGLCREGNSVDWGFYLSPEAELGSGRILGFLALEYIFEKIRINKISGQALDSNENSIRFHRRLGFQEEPLKKTLIFEGNERQLISFNLSKDEFLRLKKLGETYVKQINRH